MKQKHVNPSVSATNLKSQFISNWKELQNIKDNKFGDLVSYEMP